MFELAIPQSFMYNVDKAGLGQVCLLTGSLIIPGQCDIGKLQAACNEIFRINEMLRVCFIEKDGKVFQEVMPWEEQEFEVLRFNSKAELDAWGEVYGTVPLKLPRVVEDQTAQTTGTGRSAPDARLAFNILKDRVHAYFRRRKSGVRADDEPGVCKMKLVQLPDAYGAVVKIHHIVSDAWTCLLLGNQFFSIMQGQTPEAYSFEEFVASDRAYFESPRYDKDRRFFEAQWERCPENTYVWSTEFKSPKGLRRTVVMSREDTERINDYCAKTGFTPNVLFMAAMTVFMGRKMRRDKFYIGLLSLNRAGHKERNTAGIFINSVPLLIDLNEELSFAEYLAQVRDGSFSCIRHQKIGTETAGMPYDVVVSYQNAVLEANDRAECTQYFCQMQESLKTFSIEDRMGNGSFKLHFDHNVIVPEEDVDELFRVVLGVLKDGIADDGKKLCRLGLET